MKSTFERNLTGKSTYECGCCGRQTRETGLGEESCQLCAFCYEASGMENALSDGHIAQVDFNAQYTALVKQYGKRAHVECCTIVETETPVIETPVTSEKESKKVTTKTTATRYHVSDVSSTLDLDGRAVRNALRTIAKSNEHARFRVNGLKYEWTKTDFNAVVSAIKKLLASVSAVAA